VAIRNATDSNMTSAGSNMLNATTVATDGSMNMIGGKANMTGPALNKNLNGIWERNDGQNLNIKNDTGKGVFNVIATYASFGDTANFEYGVAQPSIPVFFQAPVLNNANVTTIEGSPAAISLSYNDGELPSADNVAYKVKFKIPNEKFRILEFDKGTFDNVNQISNDTLIFNAAKILKNENKTGLVVFEFDNSLTKNPKLTLIQMLRLIEPLRKQL